MTKKIPVIVITGLEEPELEQRMLAEGSDDFLKKPFEIDHLYRQVYRQDPGASFLR